MIRIKAVYLDGTEQETATGARAEVEFERKFGLAYNDAFHPRVQGEPQSRQEWQYFLTWASLRIQDGTFKFADDKDRDEAFDDWLVGLDDIVVLGSPSADPTRRARRPAKSSSSAS